LPRSIQQEGEGADVEDMGVVGPGGGAIPFAQQTMPCNAAPMYSNIIKKYANLK